MMFTNVFNVCLGKCPLSKFLLLLNGILLFNLWAAEADVIVMTQKSNFTVDVFADLPASFGITLPVNGLKGYVVAAKPSNACEPIQPPPKYGNYTGKWFVLIRRYDCSFVEKVRAAQLANYDAVIIHNVGSNVIEPMAGEDSDDINISAVFIGQDDGLLIGTHYQYIDGFRLLLTNELPFNINSYLLPFAIVVAICFLVMLIFMVVKCVKDRRRMRRYRLPSSSLKTIPTSKFKKGDPYDTCAICLEDYVDGDKLRLLPCSHAYHCKCIDPWLTRNRRVCPVCKRRVLVRGEHFSDSESETEDETRPLLRPGSYGTQGGTFSPADPVLAVPQNNDGPNAEEAVVQIEHSSSVPHDCISIDNVQETAPTELDEESDGICSQICDTDTESRTPPNTQALEETSIYFTPQNTRPNDTLDV